MRTSVIASTALFVSLASSGQAQVTPPRDTTAQLPTVTVTATRAATEILTAPLAITKLTTDELRSISGFGVDDALSKVPGVIAQSRYGTGDVRLMIRGYGARGAGDRSNSGTSRGVRVLLDGFPETEPDGRTALDQIDLATASAVEVIRSNGSSLWGNAAGGVVHVMTVPSVTRSTLEAQPMFGSFGLQRYVGRVATPLGTAGTAWANFTNTSFDGWREHSSTRRALLNAGVTGMIGDRTRLGLFATAANNLMHVPGPLTQAQVDADPEQANATYLARNERRYNRTGRLGVSVDHNLTATTSISSMFYVNPKYLQRSERNTFRDFTRYHIGGNVVGRTEMMFGDMRSRLTLGVDEAYQDGAILFYTLSATGGRGTTLTDNKGEGASNFGVFLQDELTVTDRLTLLLGGRYDVLSYRYRSFLAAPPVRSDRVDFDRITPKVGASFLLTPMLSIYGNVGGGIEIPAGNETDPTPGAPPSLLNPLLDPIISTTYEVGLKSVMKQFGNSGFGLGYDIALYDIEVKNDAIPYNSGRFYLTAGKGRRRGAEIGIDADMPAGVFGNAALTFSDNKYLEYVVDSAVIFPTDPSKVGAIADYSGNKVVGIPEVVTNVELGFAMPGLSGLRLSGGIEHTGKYFADDANNVEVPSFTIFNATAELRDPIASVGGWGVSGFVRVQNLTDKKYIGSAFLNPDLVGGAPAAFEPGLPRTFVVSLSLGRRR
jgi:iron complex outermembrane recepter protein